MHESMPPHAARRNGRVRAGDTNLVGLASPSGHSMTSRGRLVLGRVGPVVVRNLDAPEAEARGQLAGWVPGRQVMRRKARSRSWTPRCRTPTGEAKGVSPAPSMGLLASTTQSPGSRAGLALRSRFVVSGGRADVVASSGDRSFLRRLVTVPREILDEDPIEWCPARPHRRAHSLRRLIVRDGAGRRRARAPRREPPRRSDTGAGHLLDRKRLLGIRVALLHSPVLGHCERALHGRRSMRERRRRRAVWCGSSLRRGGDMRRGVVCSAERSHLLWKPLLPGW